MALERHPNLDEMEDKVKQVTLDAHRGSLATIEGLLNAYIAVVRESGPFTPSEDKRQQEVWLRLVARSFNSFRWAYHLIQTGYYIQAMTLTRSGLEDWLLCMDSLKHPETVEKLMSADEPRLPRFRDMAERSLPTELRGWFWGDDEFPDGAYGFLSSLAHPRHRSLMAQLNLETRTLRFGPVYDRTLFRVSAYYLGYGLLRMAEFVARIATESAATTLVNQLQPAIDSATRTIQELIDEAKAELQSTNGPSSPPTPAD